MNNYYSSKREDMLSMVPANCSKILEIGTGDGAFRDNFKDVNEYWGVEPHLEAAQKAMKRLDKTIIGKYNDIESQIPEKYFDLIVCNDVIEHVDDYIFFIRSLSKKMTNNGYLVASIPNVRCLFIIHELLIKKDWEYTESGLLDKTHLRFFTEKSIIRLFSSNGFLVDKIVGINRLRGNFRFRIELKLASLILGKDTNFLQFAIRAKLKNRDFEKQA